MRVGPFCYFAAFLSAFAGWSGRAEAQRTATPIRHLVVIFDENVSFDHYFGTYPQAANPPGQPVFTAKPGTPEANTLITANLLTKNPNFTNVANKEGAANPFRLDRAQAATADQSHRYTDEQKAYNGGKADLFPRHTGRGTPGAAGVFGTSGQVMGYFDGNTVTSLWRYAQTYAMSDNAYADTYGPSTLGALAVVSGQTNGVDIVTSAGLTQTVQAVAGHPFRIADGQGGDTLIADTDPAYDLCSSAHGEVLMKGRNIGDLLTAAGVTWGGFMAGFNLDLTNANGTTGCKRATHSSITGQDVRDYVPHHNWFQYYPSTANPRHLRPGSVAAIGHNTATDGTTPEPANHQYDLKDFIAAVSAGNVPEVAFIKQAAYQDGHSGYSNPLDEQAGLTTLINFLQRQPAWKSMAVIIAWDDSDGWYDHAFTAPANPSFDPEADHLNGPGKCGTGVPMAGGAGKPVNGRCGPGPRLPFLVISPWAKPNYVSHARITQVSVTRFIEDNWLHGQRLGGGSFDATAGSIADLFDFKGGGTIPPLWLDPATGDVLAGPPAAP